MTEKQSQIENPTPQKFRCSNCNSAQTYVLKNGTRVCRKCSFRDKKEESQNAEKTN